LGGDTVVGIGVVGGDVDGVDFQIAGFLGGFDKRFVGSSEAVIRGDDEQGSGRKFRSEVHEVPFGSVGENFAGEELWSGAGEWRHAFSGEARSEALGKEIMLVGGYGLYAVGF
jgi:hypothetical protein